MFKEYDFGDASLTEPLLDNTTSGRSPSSYSYTHTPPGTRLSLNTDSTKKIEVHNRAYYKQKIILAIISRFIKICS